MPWAWATRPATAPAHAAGTVDQALGGVWFEGGWRGAGGGRVGGGELEEGLRWEPGEIDPLEEAVFPEFGDGRVRRGREA